MHRLNCTYLHVCVCVHVYNVRTCVRIRTYIHVCMYMYRHMYVRTYIIRVYAWMDVCACMYLDGNRLRACMSAHMCV